MTIDVKIIDELIKDCKTQEDLFGDKGIVNVMLPKNQAEAKRKLPQFCCSNCTGV